MEIEIMNERPGIILVAGATGNMGGAALRHLLAEGWKVRALTRNPDSSASLQLHNLGAELVQGEYDDRVSLMHALDGAYGVFMPSFQVNLRVTPEMEIQYGIALIEAAKEAGIHHFVYTSEMDANTNTELEYLASKGRIESRIHELGLPATILRHAFFVEMLEGSFAPIVARGLAKGLGQDRTIQVISLDDVGAFAALVFNDPTRFIGQEIEIAGDEAPLAQISQTYRRVKGKDLKPTWMPYWLLTRIGQFGKFLQHLPGQETRADIEGLRKIHPELKNLEAGLRVAKQMSAPSAPTKSKNS
jgi:uncharacterized protein YbjT (DUF2867 family)